jgi:hypothetical protein
MGIITSLALRYLSLTHPALRAVARLRSIQRGLECGNKKRSASRNLNESARELAKKN